MKLNWIIATLLMTSVSAVAADAPAVYKIATIDLQKALQTVNAGKKARGNLEIEVKSKQKMIQDEENALKKLDEEFKKQSLVLNDEAKSKKIQELQERAMKFQQMRGQFQMELQKKEADLITPIIGNMKELIKDLASKKGYNVVLDKNENSVLFSNDKDDLTQDLIDTYNGKFKG